MIFREIPHSTKGMKLSESVSHNGMGFPSSGTHLVLLHPSSSDLQGWSRWSPWNRVPEPLELLELLDRFLLKKLVIQNFFP
jgi:hypothetical protein